MARAALPALLCLLLALARPAAAQNAVTMIVGYPPGGATDLMARLMQPELSAALGAQVVVKYSPGANGTVGALELARTRPDGATILLAPGGSLVLTPHTRGAPFRQEDFAPVCQVSTALVVMMTQGTAGCGRCRTCSRGRSRPPAPSPTPAPAPAARRTSA